MKRFRATPYGGVTCDIPDQRVAEKRLNEKGRWRGRLSLEDDLSAGVQAG